MNTATAPVPAVIPETRPAKPARANGAAMNRKLRARIFAGATLAAALAVGVGAYVHHVAGFESTDDAFIEGNVHPVSARVSGTVMRILVDDNAHVSAGDPLIELDPADLKLVAQSAEADLAQTRAAVSQVAAQISKARADVDAATARVAQSAAQLTRAELDFHRAETLLNGKGVISQSEFDAARAAYDSAVAAQRSLAAERTAAEAALVAVQAQQSVASAQVQKAEAALATAKLQVDYTIVRAATSGRVAKKSVEIGQRLQPGQPVMSIVGDRTWVVANFKESQLAHLKAGQKVDVRIDAIEGHAFHGTVESFSPGTGSKFSLLPPDNSTGNFTKVVQRVPVKILFAEDSSSNRAGQLAPGLSAIVKVSVRD